VKKKRRSVLIWSEEAAAAFQRKERTCLLASKIYPESSVNLQDPKCARSSSNKMHVFFLSFLLIETFRSSPAGGRMIRADSQGESYEKAHTSSKRPAGSLSPWPSSPFSIASASSDRLLSCEQASPHDPTVASPSWLHSEPYQVYVQMCVVSPVRFAALTNAGTQNTHMV
jgi:hypothetical protein